jgi:Tfp pilus assembly protein PilN
MINLLPPNFKQEVRFSKRNAILRHYLILTFGVTIVLAGALLAARYYLNTQISAVNARLADKQIQIDSHKDLEAKAKKLNARLASIQTIQKGQAKFSVLLSDLAVDMPQGTAITSLSLTGDDKKPVKLTVQAVDYKTALGFRDSITKNKRISAADIEDIHGAPSGNRTVYTVTVSFLFNPGAAR